MTSTPEVNASPSRPFPRSYETQRYDVNTIFSAPTLVTGGTFTQHNTTITSQGGFERLQDEVAATAFHNSAQRVDPPKCHPHTREAVLRHIMQWIKASENRESWILWLNGAAGAGKSAIAQTIAEMCVREGIQLASFFFSRTDPTRNTQKSLMATISYQIAQSLPFTRDLITQAIENDPLIFQRSLEVQLEHLIAGPLRQLREVDPRIISSASPFVIIIDGVDECHRRAAQIDIITTISKALRAHATPAIFLLASRNESHLIMTFNSRTTMDLLIRVALDDDYLSDGDISLYLNENFAEIKETHPLRHLIPDEWPPTELVKELVDKSSGQFIYASVVTKYVSAPNSHPVQRLEVIRGLRPTSVDTPFAQLDALYQHIFSSISNIDITLSILAYSILMRHTDIATITKFFDMPIGTVEVGLVDLSSVIACKGGYVIYLHASLPDFLLDESRSQQFYVSPSQWHTAFAHRWFVLRASLNPSSQENNPGWISEITKHLRHALPTAQLHDDLLHHKPTAGHYGISRNMERMSEFLDAIRDLDFMDDHRAYHCQLNLVTRLMYTAVPDEMAILAQRHDIREIVKKIEFEEEVERIASKAYAIPTLCFPFPYWGKRKKRSDRDSLFRSEVFR